MGTYISCNCVLCKNAPSKVKGAHKLKAHRALRRANRRAINNGDYESLPIRVSSGYRS